MNGSTTTTDLVFKNTGVFLVSESINMAPFVKATCTFGSQVASPPGPLAVGKPFAGDASCVEPGQPSVALSLQGRVTGSASVQLASGTVSTFVVQSTIRLGSSLVVGETDWYAPSLRLPVQTTIAVSGTFGTYSISSPTPTTYKLRTS